MLNNKNSYVGLTQQPQRRTYPTAGLLNSGPAVSPVSPAAPVTPAKPTTDGAFAGTSPVNPANFGPAVGAPAPTVYDTTNYGQIPGVQQPAQEPPRDKLVKAIMGGGRSGATA